jgi:2-oxo-4-hydroxy-4-carboxy--5-ureidoimidazoline (OHCU) decarboxylase
MGFPSPAELNDLSVEAFVEELAPLFEGADGFLQRLAAARPFEGDRALLEAAREVARTMPEADQVELLNAHPRIGADPSTVSAASFEEQGYSDEDGAPQGDPLVEELGMLNDVYEGRFGFRFVVFVAGRPFAEIASLIEAAMRNDRQAELGRGLDDVIDIAADRLGRLRGDDPRRERDDG